MKFLITRLTFICLFLSIATLTVSIILLRQNGDKFIALTEADLEAAIAIRALNRASIADLELIDAIAIEADAALGRLNEVESKVDVLDTSIHPDKKRNQRLLHTRDTILQQLYGGRSIKACGELDPWQVYRMAGWFVDYTDRYGVELNLTLAVAKRESLFCQKAVSNAGAVGIMQLMPETAEELSLKISLPLKRHHMEHNIRMGIYYLGQQLLTFQGNTELAVKAYNAGPTHVKRVMAGEIPDYYEQTRDYWVAIKQYQQEFKEAGL